ncbi:MAG: phage gp6-like head-tail connector protein [Prevotella sp.]|nr:phage gp6-like head-tail connector protein [Prevotella sp.]
MKFLTFDQIKAQLRLDDEQAQLERTLLEGMAEAAEDAVLTIIRRPLRNVKQVYGHVPQKLIQVTLLLVDDWYQHRGTVENLSMSAVPYAFDFMLKPMMRLAGEELPIDPVLLYLADFYGHRIKSSNGKFIVTRHQFD